MREGEFVDSRIVVDVFDGDEPGRLPGGFVEEGKGWIEGEGGGRRGDEGGGERGGDKGADVVVGEFGLGFL